MNIYHPTYADGTPILIGDIVYIADTHFDNPSTVTEIRWVANSGQEPDAWIHTNNQNVIYYGRAAATRFARA